MAEHKIVVVQEGGERVAGVDLDAAVVPLHAFAQLGLDLEAVHALPADDQVAVAAVVRDVGVLLFLQIVVGLGGEAQAVFFSEGPAQTGGGVGDVDAARVEVVLAVGLVLDAGGDAEVGAEEVPGMDFLIKDRRAVGGVAEGLGGGLEVPHRGLGKREVEAVGEECAVVVGVFRARRAEFEA